MSVNEQLQDIQRTLGKHTGLLEALNKKDSEARESFRDLWRSQSGQDKQIARLETKASSFERQARNRGAISGGIIGSIIIGIRMGWEWFAGR